MKRLVKVLGIALAAIAGLVVVAAIALVSFDWNSLRDTIGERGSAASGRKLEIRGDLGVHWSWRPEIVAHDIIFANAEWGSRPEMARIAEAYIKFRIPPLLLGRLEIDRLRLIEPDILLETDGERVNWRFGDESRSAAAVSVAAPKERSDFPFVYDLHIEGGQLTYRAPNLQAPLELRIAALDVSADDDSAPINLSAVGQYQDRDLALEAETGALRELRDKSKPYGIKLNGNLGSIAIAAEGGINEPMDFRGIDAKFDIKGDSLAELHEIFGLPLPKTKPFALAGRLVVQGRSYVLRDLAGRLGDSDLGGALEIATGGERPLIKGDLTSKNLKMNDLAGFVQKDPNKTPEEKRAEGERLLSDEPFALPKLRQMDADVRLRGRAFSSDALQVRDIDVTVSLKDGNLAFKPLKLGLAKGQIVADLGLDGRQAVPSMSSNVKVEGLDLNALLAMLGVEGQSAGTLRGQVQLATRGRSPHELGSNANGEGILVMTGGRIRNILLEALALDLQEAVGQWLGDDKTMVGVNCVVLPTQVQNGRMSLDKWVFDTTDTLIETDGLIDLGRETVVAKLKPYPKDFSLFNTLTSIEVKGNLATRTAKVSKMEAVGKLALKALAAPFMTFLSQDVETEAKQRSPCQGLFAELKRSGEGAAAEGQPGGPDSRATRAAKKLTGEAAGPARGRTAGPSITSVQEALNRQGQQVKVDGIMGRQTQEALLRFQRQAGLEATGRLDGETLSRLGVGQPGQDRAIGRALTPPSPAAPEPPGR